MIGDRLKKDEKFDSIYVYLPLNKIILQFKIIYSTQIFKHFREAVYSCISLPLWIWAIFSNILWVSRVEIFIISLWGLNRSKPRTLRGKEKIKVSP